MAEGDGGTRELVLTAEGRLSGRRAAERWKRAAATVPGWTLSASRVAPPGGRKLALRFSEGTLHFDELELLVNPSRFSGRLDVGVWHPLFPSMPEQARSMVSSLLLDHTIGEDAAMSWIAGVHVLTESPGEHARSRAQLCELVNQVAEKHDETAVVLLKGVDRKRGPVLTRVAPALKALKHLDHEHLLEASFSLPEDTSSVHALEDTLLQALGEDFLFAVHHIYLAERVLELTGYVSQSAAAERALTARRSATPNLKWTLRPDPEWESYWELESMVADAQATAPAA
jgi:hypothetical protein